MYLFVQYLFVCFCLNSKLSLFVNGLSPCDFTDGTSANAGDCTCGNTICTGATGLICYNQLSGGSCRTSHLGKFGYPTVTSSRCNGVSGREVIVDQKTCEAAARRMGLNDTTATLVDNGGSREKLARRLVKSFPFERPKRRLLAGRKLIPTPAAPDCKQTTFGPNDPPSNPKCNTITSDSRLRRNLLTAAQICSGGQYTGSLKTDAADITCSNSPCGMGDAEACCQPKPPAPERPPCTTITSSIEICFGFQYTGSLKSNAGQIRCSKRFCDLSDADKCCARAAKCSSITLATMAQICTSGTGFLDPEKQENFCASTVCGEANDNANDKGKSDDKGKCCFESKTIRGGPKCDSIDDVPSICSGFPYTGSLKANAADLFCSPLQNQTLFGNCTAADAPTCCANLLTETCSADCNPYNPQNLKPSDRKSVV